MSENKDLEIIKLCNAIRNFSKCELDYGTLKTLKMIENEAERMAAEIEQLKKEVSEKRISCYDHIKETIGLKDYIARLKAELEKRPEITCCKDCIYKNQCKAVVIFQESTEGPFKFYYLNFCSYGQRKSEEGK